MRIAITADVHLTTRSKHPERFNALENLLDQLLEKEIHTLIIAGDLFDASCNTPGEFEEVIKKKYANIVLYIIPGNHDPVLSPGTFSLPNIKYITQPQLIKLDGVIPFVLIPYQNGSSVGEILAECQFPVEAKAWVLVSHGDWITGTTQNRYEEGTYLPLSARDLLLYRPKKAFLGHIHAQIDSEIVHYPGSPCAIDPTETGYRYFLVMNTDTWQISRLVVDTEYLFFNEQITILPLEEEEMHIKNLLSQRSQAWNVPPVHHSKIRIRVKVRGFSRDRKQLAKVIQDHLKNFQFADQDQPDISQVKISNDLMQERIAKLVKQKIDTMQWDPSPEDPDRDDVLLASLDIIYGGK